MKLFVFQFNKSDGKPKISKSNTPKLHQLVNSRFLPKKMAAEITIIFLVIHQFTMDRFTPSIIVAQDQQPEVALPPKIMDSPHFRLPKKLPLTIPVILVIIKSIHLNLQLAIKYLDSSIINPVVILPPRLGTPRKLAL